MSKETKWLFKVLHRRTIISVFYKKLQCETLHMLLSEENTTDRREQLILSKV